MKGFLHIHEAVKKNRLNTFESNRFLRLLVIEAPNFPLIRESVFFTATNTAQLTRPTPDTENPNSGISMTTELRRIRRVGTRSFLAPAPPNQVAFALGRIYAGYPTGITPTGIVSEVDINLNQIGNIFGHPTGREALFNETAIVPTGVGVVTPGGTLAQSVSERGHYIYFIRILDTGSATTGTYFYQRFPYQHGAYFPGSSEQDTTTGIETLLDRFPSTTETRASTIATNLIPLTGAGFDPPSINYQLQWPTADALSNGDTVYPAGVGYDGAGQYWVCMVNNQDNDNVAASRGRSVWTWDKFTGQIPIRRDADDNFSSGLGITNYPTLPTNVQYRDLKAARGGFMFVAADGTNDDGAGTAETGALIQIDSANNLVEDVHGTTVTGIYTVGGLLSNDIVAITVDQTESVAAAGFDRVWVQHRNGLSYGDMNITTGTISSWTTVADAGAGVNVIDVNSIRGIGGALNQGGVRNGDIARLDHDSSGNIYWVSSQGVGNYTAGINRLNRLTADLTTHTYYSLDDAAEGGAVGFIQLGETVTGTINYGCFSLQIHRPDAGDPDNDDIYISGLVITATTNAFVRQFSVDDWGTSNPGVGYYNDLFNTPATARPTVVQIAPDGSFYVIAPVSNEAALLTSLGDVTPVNGSGTGASFAASVGSTQAVTLAGGSNFDTRWVNRQVRFTNTTNAANAGSFRVTAVASGTSITVNNAAGVAETSAFSWAITGDELDSRSTSAGALNATADDADHLCSYRMWPDGDDSGQALHLRPLQTLVATLAFVSPFFITYNYDSVGDQWYRRKRVNVAAGPGRTLSTSAQTLDSGVTATFANSGAGGDEFVAEEYYTFGASIGLIKDPTQELSYLYDFYPSETALIARPTDAEGTQNKTASYSTATGGFIAPGDLSGVLTDNPFTGITPAQGRQIAFPQRQFLLDGTNNTETVSGSGAFNTNAGPQVAVDLGSDIVISQLRWLQQAEGTNTGDNRTVGLYSASAAAGPASWTLRGTFTRTTDTPGLIYRTDATRTAPGDNNTAQALFETIFDTGELENTGIFGTNVAQRYWKVTYLPTSGSTTLAYTVGNLSAVDSGGSPAGFTDAQYLNTAPDSNWLGDFVIRAVFVLDTGAGTAARGPADNQVTLTADTFATDIGQGDFFRVLSGSTILQELVVDTRDSDTQLTFTTDAAPFAAATWEVVRNVDVRPRDDAGGSENVSQFPPSGATGEGQVYIDPITGFIYYNDNDVTNARTYRTERYVKVIRAV